MRILRYSLVFIVTLLVFKCALDNSVTFNPIWITSPIDIVTQHGLKVSFQDGLTVDQNIANNLDARWEQFRVCAEPILNSTIPDNVIQNYHVILVPNPFTADFCHNSLCFGACVSNQFIVLVKNSDIEPADGSDFPSFEHELRDCVVGCDETIDDCTGKYSSCTNGI